MSNEVKLNWIGKELEEALLKLGDAGEKIEGKAAREAAKILKTEIKKETLAIYDEGDLYNSIKISGVRTGESGKYVWVGDVDRKAVHGWYVEFGTTKAKANPFMDRSHENKKEEMTEVMIDVIRKELGI